MQITQFKKNPDSKKYSVLLIGLLGYLFIGLLPPQANAEGVSLKISPSTFQIRSTPPADIRLPFKLTNQGDDSVELTIILKNFESSFEENGQLSFIKPDLIDEREKDNLLQNVQIVDNGFAVNSLTLSPKQEKKLELVITVPKNSPPQDHYFSLIFLTQVNESGFNQQDTEGETISQNQIGISFPILLAIGRSENNTGFIDEFSAPIFLQSGPVPFTIKIKNTGTHFISPKGAILLKNMFGQTIGRVDIPTTNILAGTSRYLSNVSSQSKTVWREKLLLGLYTAKLTIADENNELLYTRSIHFLAFPFVFLVGFGVAIFLFIVIFRRIKKRLAQE